MIDAILIAYTSKKIPFYDAPLNFNAAILASYF
jgi:hypothetical protein